MTSNDVPARAGAPREQRLRAQLERQWRQQVDEIARLTVQLLDLEDAVSDRAADAIERGLLATQLAAARRAAERHEQALERLADGSYGVCAACGLAIDPERLDALPEARLCAPCQQRVAGRG